VAFGFYRADERIGGSAFQQIGACRKAAQFRGEPRQAIAPHAAFVVAVPAARTLCVWNAGGYAHDAE
jgi:hypothetical protein